MESLRPLGVATILLHHYDVEILVHINPKLDVGSAAIKLAAGSFV
jgi:hypothetical protein